MILGIHPLILLITLVGFAAEITVVIIGFIIVSGKIKSVKILGIGYIVTGIIGIVTQASFLARNIVRTSDIIRILINVDTAAAVVSSLFGLLCVCLFVHKNYGCKWIYFPLFAQPIVSAFSRVVSGFVLSRIGGEGVLIAGTGFSTNVTSLVTGTVTAIILIVVFYRNRKNEKIIPHAWIIRLITYCWSLVMIIASIGFYAFCLSGGSGAESIYFEHIENFSIFQTIYTLFGSFVGIVMPVYILVMAKRAERKLEETSAYIED